MSRQERQQLEQKFDRLVAAFDRLAKLPVTPEREQQMKKLRSRCDDAAAEIRALAIAVQSFPRQRLRYRMRVNR